MAAASKPSSLQAGSLEPAKSAMDMALGKYVSFREA
jgi:hypothetical protein